MVPEHSRKTKRILLICNPGEGTTSTLPFTFLEAKRIEAMHRDAQVTSLYGSEATLERVRKSWPESDVVVFGSHCTSLRNRGLWSYFQLWKPHSPSVETQNEVYPDGVLSALDIIVGMPRLPSGSLVIANACDTAVGDARDWNENQSMAAALLLRGPSNVLANAWPVNDIAAAVFSEAFVSELNRTKSPGVAYRNAIEKVQRLTSDEADALVSETQNLLAAEQKFGPAECDRLKNVGKRFGGQTMGFASDFPIGDLQSPIWWAPFMLFGRL